MSLFDQEFFGCRAGAFTRLVIPAGFSQQIVPTTERAVVVAAAITTLTDKKYLMLRRQRLDRFVKDKLEIATGLLTKRTALNGQSSFQRALAAESWLNVGIAAEAFRVDLEVVDVTSMNLVLNETAVYIDRLIQIADRQGAKFIQSPYSKIGI